MDGVLIVDKPRGITSHDVVDFIRKKFELKKVGHAGTLDPMATGVLVVLIGKLTKSSQELMSCDKEYEGELTLGAVSDTGDACGKVLPTGKTFDLTQDQIMKAFDKFSGDILQNPPMYSARKYKGQKLYQLARKGIDVKVEPRRVSIKKIEVLDISLPRISFRIACSKGTYIRQLAVDIGNELGCGAYLSALRRTRSGRFTINTAITIDKLKNMKSNELEEIINNQDTITK